jgi:hypothetical protein
MPTPGQIRARILKQRGVEFKKLTRKPVKHADIPTPFAKSRLMQLLELRYEQPIEKFIFKGTIYEAARVHNISPATVYKWRTLITTARDKEFFDQFKETPDTE